MLLRRITKHVKDQNWFAVGLDFLIVVMGIWVALMVSQWTEKNQQRKDLERAEAAINTELQSSYYYAYERLATTSCRIGQYQQLADMLLDMETPWPGAPDIYGEGALTEGRAFKPVLRSPARPWASIVWDAEIDKGTLDIMDAQKLAQLSTLYQGIKTMQDMQANIFRFESRLQVLANPLDLSMSDRLRYYDILTEADAIASLLELGAGATVNSIETNGLVTFTDTEKAEVRAFLEERNRIRADIYGDCTENIILPLLGDNDET